MPKTASQIVDRALTLIDEVPTTVETAATTETSIREQALEILPEVCRDLVKELPLELKKYLEQYKQDIDEQLKMLQDIKKKFTKNHTGLQKIREYYKNQKNHEIKLLEAPPAPTTRMRSTSIRVLAVGVIRLKQSEKNT